MGAERCFGSSIAIAVVIHLVALSVESCERKILHHPHQSAGIAIVVAISGKNVFPLVVVGIKIHAQLGMEVLVLIPGIVYAIDQCSGQTQLC